MGQLQSELDLTIELLRTAPRTSSLRLEHDCYSVGDLAVRLWDIDEYHHPVLVETTEFRSFTIDDYGDYDATGPLCADEPDHITGFFRGFTAESSVDEGVDEKCDRPGLVTESLTHPNTFAFMPLDGVVAVHLVTEYLDDRGLLIPITSCLLGAKHAKIDELANIIYRTNATDYSTTARVLEVYMNQLCKPSEVMSSVVGDFEFLNPRVLRNEETGELLVLGATYAFGTECPVTEDYLFTVSTHPMTHTTCLALGSVANDTGETSLKTIYIPRQGTHRGLGGFEGFTLPHTP